MTSLKLVGAALMLSTAFATPVFAQIPLPGDYSSEPVYARSPAFLRSIIRTAISESGFGAAESDDRSAWTG